LFSQKKKNREIGTKQILQLHGDKLPYLSSTITIIQNMITNANNLRPLFQCFHFAMGFYKNISSCIIGLFLSCCPSAVFLIVAERIYLAFKRVLRGRWISNVFMEVLKLLPSLRNPNATSAIVGICPALWVATPFFHRKPYLIDTSFRFSMRGLTYIQTTAGSRSSRAKVLAAYRFFLPTIATTQEKSSLHGIIADHSFQDNKPPESLPSKVNETPTGLFPETSAGICMPTSKMTSAYRNNIATVAFTQPFTCTGVCPNLVRYRFQFAELLSSKINKAWHYCSFFKYWSIARRIISATDIPFLMESFLNARICGAVK